MLHVSRKHYVTHYYEKNLLKKRILAQTSFDKILSMVDDAMIENRGYAKARHPPLKPNVAYCGCGKRLSLRVQV